MVLTSLDEIEIIEIRKTLETIFVKDSPSKEHFMQVLLKWFKNRGISTDSSQKIVAPFIAHSFECHDKTTDLNGIRNLQYHEPFMDLNTIEQEITKLLVDIEGQENALRILGILKSIIPQKNLFNTQSISPYLNCSIYGILSYDGPVVAICNFQNKQIVKGYFIRREDTRGREYRAIRIGEVLVEACPVNVIIHHSDSETKFEVEWVPYIGKSFTLGPCSLVEMVSSLKYKDLVPSPSVLETALIAICRAFVEAGLVTFKNRKIESGYQMNLSKWMAN